MLESLKPKKSKSSDDDNQVEKQNKKKSQSTNEKKEAKRKRKQEAERQKRQKKQQKRKEKNKKVRGRDDYLAPIAGYDFLPSFIKAGKQYGTVLKIDNKFGMNREMSFGWFIHLIPKITVDNVKAYMLEVDKTVDKTTQQEIMTKKISKVIRANSEDNSAEVESSGDKRIKSMTVDDFERASQGDAGVERIIDAHIHILLVSDNPDDISTQLRKLNTRYGDEMTGVQSVSTAGDQEELFNKMMEAPRGTVYDYTWMSGDFSGNDHAVRKGLDDRRGIPVGDIIESYSSGTSALMALDESFKRRILIGAYEESIIAHDYPEESTAPSMWGQLVANNAMMNGKRTFHIVMNDFKYYGEPDVENNPSDYDAEPIVNTQINYMDMSKGGINPLEMFGNLSDVVNIYNSNLTKLTHMFNLMSNRKLETYQSAPMVDLNKALNRFYISRKLWDENAHKNPKITRVLNIKEHDTFPRMGDFINTIASMLLQSEHKQDEEERRNAKLLSDILDNALSSYRGIFNEPTTLPDPANITKLQNYFDLSDLKTNPNIMEAQFLNVFDYVATACREGDILMIHGIDKLSVETLELIENRLNILNRDKVRIAYIFDTIGSGESKKQKNVARANIFNTEGVLYQNFDMQFDYTILGSMTKQDLKQYEDKVKQKLTRNLKETLTASDAIRQYQIRRKSDLTTVIVIANFLI